MPTESDAIRRTVVLVVVAVAAAVALVAAVSALGAPSGAERMVSVSSCGVVSLAELDADLRQLYRDAAADPEAFTQVRCYCGCEAMLDHRHLLDCFERPDGGWERHAVGCAVCQLEARDVLAARAAGTPMPEIIAAIDDTYAGITEENG